MLAHDRVVLAEFQLFGGLARVLLGRIEKAGISRAEQLDENGGGLGHSRKIPNRELNQAAENTVFRAGVKGNCSPFVMPGLDPGIHGPPGRARGDEGSQTASAASRSAIRSSTSSTPTERRTNCGVTPISVG